MDYLTFEGLKKKFKEFNELIAEKIRGIIPTKIIILTPTNVQVLSLFS